MVYQQESSTVVDLLEGYFEKNDELNFWANTTYTSRGKAKIIAVEQITDQATKIKAYQVQNAKVGYRDRTGAPLYRVTLDRNVTLSQADLGENRTQRGDYFEMQNCIWKDATVRIMIQGFKSGLIDNNQFTRIGQGLAVTMDAWWWEGGTWDSCIITNNTFTQTPYVTYWKTAAIHYGPSISATNTDIFSNIRITDNTITKGNGNGIYVNNTNGGFIFNNTITGMTTTPLRLENNANIETTNGTTVKEFKKNRTTSFILPSFANGQIKITGDHHYLQVVKITNLTGRVVYACNEPFAGLKQVDATGWANGIYCVSITGKNSSRIMKIIIK